MISSVMMAAKWLRSAILAMSAPIAAACEADSRDRSFWSLAALMAACR